MKKPSISYLKQNERLIIDCFNEGDVLPDSMELVFNPNALNKVVDYGLVEWVSEGYRITAEGKEVLSRLNELQKRKEEVEMKGDVEKLVKYVRGLKDLDVSIHAEDSSIGYEHVGAIIADAVLQAGLNYKYVVSPRVEKLREKYPGAETLSGFKKLIENETMENIISFKSGSRKAQTIRDMVHFFQLEGLETTEELKQWIGKDDNRNKLKKIKGVGDKTVRYLAVLVGLSDAPIDTHIRKFILNAGIHVDDKTASEIMKFAAQVLDIPLPQLDNSIWKYMSDRSIKKEKALEYLSWIKPDGSGRFKVKVKGIPVAEGSVDFIDLSDLINSDTGSFYSLLFFDEYLKKIIKYEIDPNKNEITIIPGETDKKVDHVESVWLR